MQELSTAIDLFPFCLDYYTFEGVTLLYTSDDMKAKKPQAILDLEKTYNIDIPDLSSQEGIDPWIDRYFKQDSSGAVVELCLVDCRIDCMAWVVNFPSLKSLDLCANQLSTIEGLENLSLLINVDLRENKIREIEGLVGLASLKTLGLGSNQISKIKGLESLASLSNLNLGCNQISRIEGLESLTSLTSLDLGSNQINKIEGLESLTSLTSLDLSSNQINKIEGLESLTSLTSLDLGSNQINKIEGLESLTSLTILFLSHNQIRKIEGFCSIGSLTALNMDGNQISKIEGLESLTSLEYLFLDDNQITHIEGLGSLTSLEYLFLDDNQINKIGGLDSLISLRNFHIGHNQISDIKDLMSLTMLRDLYLGHNQIREINGLDRLKVLQKLDVSNNDIKSINDIKSLALILKDTLESLTINNNPFIELSGLLLSPYENHLPEIKALLEKEEQKEVLVKYDPFCKVMLLGNHSSGKSTFLKKYDPNYRFKGSTHVLSVHRTTEPNAIFYDFGGQDYYHGIYQAFFTIQSLYLLFWQTETDRNFERQDRNGFQTRNFNRPYWLGQIAYACTRCLLLRGKQNNEDNPQITGDTIIIQTHADKEGARQQTLGCIAGDSVLEEIYVSLKSKGKSARYARRYLNERVREVIANRNKPIEITEKDKRLYEALPSIAERCGHRPISLEDLASELNKLNKIIAPNSSLYTKDYLQVELNQLSLRGEVLYYRYNKKLNSYVWLDPAAFVQKIHGEILQKDDINRGAVPKEIFERKLHNLSTGGTCEEHDQNGNMILQLLLEELIVYEDKDCYVIPGYLPLYSDDEAYKWLTWGFKEPNFVLKFECFIPFGLINQIIAYYGREEGALKRYWRDQVIFTAGREIDMRQLEPESKSLPKTNAEDYLIWIKLDFTDLAISVFIKELRRKSTEDVKRKETAILNDILDMYWNNIPPTDILRLRLFFIRLNVKWNNNPERGLRGYTKDTDKKRRFIRETNRKKSPIQDLYLSYAEADKDLTESHYIHLGTLDDESKTTARIAAYPLKDGAIDKERVREVSTRPYKHLSVNKKLSGVKRVFISYSKHDREELEQCLLFFKPLVKSGHIELYYDELTKFETPIHSEIRRRITGADCIIALVSQNYLGTDYILDHELPVIEDYEKTLIPIQIKPCTFYEVETLSKHYFALKAKVVNLDSRIFTVPDGVTASALREQNWCDVVREFKEKILGITKQEVNTDE